MPVITLLTDFGTVDEYAGVMKGVIHSLNPEARIVDITHHIPPQDVAKAALILDASFSFFPEGTVHATVVDPGVGSNRGIIALKAAGHIFLAPDNGVLSLILDRGEAESAFLVENSDFFLSPVSNTFHGRDIFAPVAARLAKEEACALGPQIPIEDLFRLSLPKPRVKDSKTLTGQILTTDRFGNLMTNVDNFNLTSFCKPEFRDRIVLQMGKTRITGLSLSYAHKAPDSLLMIMGSRGYLEISANCGDAAKKLCAKPGDEFTLSLPQRSSN